VIISKPYKEIVSKGRDLCTRIKSWWREYRTFLILAIFIFFIILITVWPLARNFLNRNSGALTVVSSIVIAFAALYFSEESVKLEKTKLKPRLTLLRPFLVEHQLIIPIKNIGLGPALYVHFSISNKEGGKISPFAPEIGYIDYLSPNQCHEISLPATLLKNQIMIKKGTEIFQEQEFEIYYCDFLGKSYIEEYPIPEKYLIDFDQLEIYWENNLKTISDTLEWRS